MANLSSNELNFLVFRYLEESGFLHSAFTLGYEAGLNKNPIDGNEVPPGALVSFVQKGLQYLELEANLSEDGSDIEGDFTLLQPVDLLTKGISELRTLIKERKENLEKEKTKEKEKEREREREKEREKEKERERERERLEKEREREQERERVERERTERERVEREREREREKDKEKEREKEREREREKELERERDREREREWEREREREREREQERERELEQERELEREQERERERECQEREEREREEKNAIIKVEDPLPVVSEMAEVKPAPLEIDIPQADVTILEGHTSEVFICAWSPTGSLLASGSGDSTARIWTIPDGPSGIAVQSSVTKPLVLKHFKGKVVEKSRDVTTLDWNGDGTLLATGCYDGQARIWSKDGELKNTLNRHKGPIFSLKWNKKGDLLLSGSVDKTAIIWDAKGGEVKQQFEFHTAPTLDVDWRNNASFATCSTDKSIYVCKLGEARPVKHFAGHRDEVNAIKWDPSGLLLASCSDDCTAKIWSLKHDKCVHDLKDHTKEIYTIKWSPTGPGTANTAEPLKLASASFDATIKLWHADRGVPLFSLTQHTEPVYSVAFSPNGEYLASGSFDKCLHIWSVRDGSLVKTYTGSGGIFEVCWNKEGDKVAACFSNNTVCVLDFRM